MHGTISDEIIDDDYRTRARQQYHEEGVIEIDNTAVVSRGADGGAYVAAWVWVDAPAD